METITRTLKLLGHPDRLRILALLNSEELTVSELVLVLGLSQPRVTQYIKSLEDAGMVERLREGAWVFSRLATADTPTQRLVVSVLSSLPDDDPVLAEDAERLEAVRSARADRAQAFFADVANDRGRLSHEFLPQAPVEEAIVEALGERRFGRMVDLGTGSGRMLALLSDRAKGGVGIDLSPDMLRVARYTLSDPRYSHLSVQQGDLTRSGLPDADADLVLLHQVLHHLHRPADALCEASRILASGGTLLVVDFAEHDREEFRERFAHRRLGFSRDELGAVISSHGFDNVTARRIPGSADTHPDLFVWTARRVSVRLKTEAST